MPTHIDIVDGNAGTLTGEGWEFIRIATVSGVTGDGDLRLYNAVIALGLSIGAAHPAVPNCVLATINADAKATDVVSVRLTYRTPQGSLETNPIEPEDVLIRVGGRLTDREENKDVNGDLLEVEYLDAAGETRLQSGTVTVLRPEHTLRFDVVVAGEDLPGHISKTFLGKINSAGWWHDPETAAAGKWLCTDASAESRDGGATYQMAFEFQYREQGWDHTVAYQDPETGRIPADVVDGDGVRDYTMYESIDFNSAPFPVGNSP